MSQASLIQEVLALSPRDAGRGTKTVGLLLVALGVVGAGLGFLAGDARAGWVALYVSTAMVIGLAAFGAVLSAIFELTGAKWGRAYRRLAEGSAVLMPLGLLGLIALVAAAGWLLPWAQHHDAGHHLSGGKAVWLTLPFWSARVLLALLLAYAVFLAFLYYSLRRDFCLTAVRERYTGRLAAWVARGISDEADAWSEAERCSSRLALLAPVTLIVYALAFTLLGFDLIMALEPDWFSTLFGAWYFIGHVFAGLALLAVVSLVLRRQLGLASYLTPLRQADLATLLFAFCLVNTDFFWSQFLTIWYGNLPEETGYVVRRVHSAPWRPLSFTALAAFFAIPFVALIFRRVKRSGALLAPVALIVIGGVLLARFLEIAPPLLDARIGGLAALRPLAATLLVLLGFAGAGWLLYRRLLASVPLMPVGDAVFVRAFDVEQPPQEGHA